MNESAEKLLWRIGNRFVGMALEDLTVTERQIYKLMEKNGILTLDENHDIRLNENLVIPESFNK